MELTTPRATFDHTPRSNSANENRHASTADTANPSGTDDKDATEAKGSNYMGPATARLVLMIFMWLLLIVALGLSFLSKNGNWKARHQFALHAYEKHMDTSTEFTGPFLSKVYVLPSVRGVLYDASPSKHGDCMSDIFMNNTEYIAKCKMMRSAPMYLGNVTNSWSVLGAQSVKTLSLHMFVNLLLFILFWLCEFVLTEYCPEYKHVVPLRNVILFLAVALSVMLLALNVTSNMSADVAIGSVSTAFFFVVVTLHIICFEYAGMNGQIFQLASEKKKEGAMQTNGDPEHQSQTQPTPEIIKPQKQHIYRNIYLSYASLLMFPMVVVVILTQTHRAIVDVHIQLCFFSFIFYATLDVFQTRTTAVLLCLKTEVASTQAFGQIKLFVVLAFSLCKCFVLLPALVLLHSLYAAGLFQQAMLWVHYVVLVGMIGADLWDIKWSTAFTDVVKVFLMAFYTIFACMAIVLLDPQ